MPLKTKLLAQIHSYDEIKRSWSKIVSNTFLSKAKIIKKIVKTKCHNSKRGQYWDKLRETSEMKN